VIPDGISSKQMNGNSEKVPFFKFAIAGMGLKGWKGSQKNAGLYIFIYNQPACYRFQSLLAKEDGSHR